MDAQPIKNLTKSGSGISEGLTFSKIVTFEPAAIRHFAALAGDDNVLHHNEEQAKASPFGGLIASGTHTSSLMIGALASYVSAKGRALGLSHTMQFRRGVKAGSTWSVTWTIDSIKWAPKLSGHLISSSGVLVGRSGEVAVNATAETLFYDPL